MDLDPQIPTSRTSDKNSFAYVTARDRWPVIITQAIDDVHRTTIVCKNTEQEKEGKAIIEYLAKLKYELQHDRQMSPLPDDGESDAADYNQDLSRLGNVKWFDSPWLFGECYLYRRINTQFVLSSKWKTYDVFARQKMSSFRSSRPAVIELAARYKDIVTELETSQTVKGAKSEEELLTAEEVLFTEMCEICLWGNATDLSLLTNLSYEDIQKLQGSQARKAAEKNIIANDLNAAFQVLSQAKKSGKPERRLDIVLDNAGFELFVDLILSGYLLAAGLATTIVLHPKSFPWFVSDVLPKDFADLLNAVAEPQEFYSTLTDDDKLQDREINPLAEKEVQDLRFLFEHWSHFHAEGKLVIRPNRFWTGSGSFWRLPKVAPDLFEDLKESELVIYKGDLNYRKLVGDAWWDPTTPFAKAIGPLGPESGLRTLTLRTCKADVVVGLPKGEDERLRDMNGGGGNTGARKWAWNGKWAVIQFCDGKA